MAVAVRRCAVATPRSVDAALGVVHRLDKHTSGLMVFARTAHAKRALATQFREHTIDRVYHLDRGYESIEEKLSRLGARIRRVQ